MNGPCVVVVGLDGLSFNHVMSLVELGLLPNLQALLRDGASATLVSSTPWQTPVGWTTYATGANPGVHGVYGWWSPNPVAGQLRPTSGSQVQLARVWEILSAAGRRVGVVNVPMSYPARPVNGFLLAGLDSPSFEPEVDQLFAYPRTAVRDLAAAGIDYRLMPEQESDRSLAETAAAWAEVERRRGEAVLALMEQHRPQFLQVNLFLTDYLAHRALPSDPSFVLGYQTADEVVGRVRKAAGQDALFLIMSDHGSNPIDRFVMIHNLLREQGLLQFGPWLADEQVAGVLGLPSSDPEVRELIDRLRRGGRRLREAMYLDVEHEHPGANVGFSTIDWDRTRAYCTSDYGQVRINRERGEAAAEGPEQHRRVADAIRRALFDLEDPGRDGPLVDQVVDREMLYRGPLAGLGPDLTPVLADHANYFCQVYSFYRSGDQRVVAPVEEVVDPVATGCVGDHNPYGVLVMAGPGTPTGVRLDDASILDMAPTILREFGLAPLPEHEGVVLEDFRGGRRPSRNPSVEDSAATDEGLRQRLLNLGYRI